MRKPNDQQEPPIVVSMTEAALKLGELVNRSAYGRKRIRLARRGEELVAIVPIADLEFLEKHAPIDHPVAIPA